MEKISVLYVDDEENNLSSFRSFFRKEYTVYTATSAEAAFEIMKEHPMHIIITDQRMPGMSGVEFLEKTIETDPDAIRALITGHSDINSVIGAVNKGQITKYIEKPWDWDKLRITLEYCADLYKGRMEMKLKNALLTKANEELNRFIYSASHDLRSPLMSILGVIQLARAEGSGNPVYMELIEKSVTKLDQYIRNIIDYYQNSRAEGILDKIDFKALTDEVIWLVNIGNKGQEFRVNVDQNAGFYGDAFRVRLILSNLISNAQKYADPDKSEHLVEINVDVDEQKAKIRVADNGIGIPPEQLDHVFKMFFRAHGANSRQGSGLGLFIVKEILDALNGTISVKSEPGKGTTFEVEIPNTGIPSVKPES